MKYLKITLMILVVAMGSTACKKKKIRTMKTDFKETYANIVHANYEDAYNDVVTLKSALETLVATPSEANLTASKT